MAKLKQEKLAVQIQKYISDIIQFELKTNNLGIVTVTRVKVSDDNSWAKVYVSFLNKDKEKSLENLIVKKIATQKILRRLFYYGRKPLNFMHFYLCILIMQIILLSS